MRKTKSKAMRKRDFLIRSYITLLSVVLVLSLSAIVTQTVFANTYVITDGDKTVTVTTFETDPAQVLDQAGVPLEENDTYTTEALEGGAAITVTRAGRVTVHYHGQTAVAASRGETAGQLLQRLGLEVTGEDAVSHGLEEETFDGMVLTVNRIVTSREVFSSAIPHETRYVEDENIPAGTEAVLIPGQDGELLRTADVTYVNGTETCRSIVAETKVRNAVTEVVAVGTGETPAEADMPVIGDGYIRLPTGETLTYTHSDTVEATAYTHTDEGCDLITATGTTVRWGTVAVDPSRIPYGTRMFVIANDGSYVYGIATAEDCGGDIKGDRMDLYFPTYEECIQFGRRVCTIYYLGQ